MKTKRIREGQVIKKFMGFVALVETEVDIRKTKDAPPKLVDKFVQVGPCLASRYLVEQYLKQGHHGPNPRYRIEGRRVDATPIGLRHNR